jgi:hypothetical protein
MKAAVSKLLLIALIPCLFACNAAKEDPVAVAKTFYEALAMQDYAKAKMYATKDSKTMIELLESMSQMNNDAKGKDEDLAKMKSAVFTQESIDGDRASVKVKMNNEENLVKLKKEDGAWKVALDKESIQETMREKTGEPMNNVNDALEKAGDAIQQAGDEMNKAMEEAGEAVKKAGETVKEAGKEAGKQ